jgi:phosphatidylglycerophosphate synthase
VSFDKEEVPGRWLFFLAAFGFQWFSWFDMMDG